jgi:3-oxoacyl-[acyl-carrier-protein] synthase III
MPCFRIVGSGRFLPGRPYSNHDLARVMDTSDEWVRQRTGIETRHYCPDGVGAADLAEEAAKLALNDAGLVAADIDYILFNTMTPDHLFPGSAPLLGAKLGISGVPALDLRTQCAAMIFSLQVAEGLFASGAARRILIASAENHAAFMPWSDWEVLEGSSQRKPSAEAWDRASRHRGLAIIFGDGAGALVLERCTDGKAGILAIDVHSAGELNDELLIPVGFRRRPYVSHADIDADRTIPQMNGREVFRHAVSKLPATVRTACEKAGLTLNEIDWFIGHQANERINALVRERLNVPAEKMPSNIARYGNTSSATIPILLDEMRRDGRLQAGQQVCVFALGAGLHWGAAVLRV